MIWPYIIGGALLALSCAYGIWWLIKFLLFGISTSSWPTIVGGGILIYVFIGLLFIGIIVGVTGFVIGVQED